MAPPAQTPQTAGMKDKPFSPACARNREPILAVLRDFFADRRHVLEIGSGTGQHAVHFAAALPHLAWQTSERAENLADVRAWLDDAALANTPAPLTLDVASGAWPSGPFDAVFSANTLHIMGWSEVEALFAALPDATTADAKLAVYGPFNVDGHFTSRQQRRLRCLAEGPRAAHGHPRRGRGRRTGAPRRFRPRRRCRDAGQQPPAPVAARAVSTPLLLAWSGGKDCAFALQRLLGDPHWRVAGLLTTVTTDDERISSHGVRRTIVHAQAERLGLPLFEARIPPQASNAVYEAAFAQALDAARAATPGLATIAFGDLHLADVRAYREQQLARLGWRGRFPLWGEDTARLARRLIADGFRAIVCCVDTEQLDAAFCGREFDATLLADLPASCDPCGENGEFHTCVYAGPLWDAPLQLTRGEQVMRAGRFQYVELSEAVR